MIAIQSRALNMLPLRPAGPASVRVRRSGRNQACSSVLLLRHNPLCTVQAAGASSYASASAAAHGQQHVALLRKPKRFLVLAAHPTSKKKKRGPIKGPASPQRGQAPRHSAKQHKSSQQLQQRPQQHKQQRKEPQQHSQANVGSSSIQQEFLHSQQQQPDLAQPQSKSQQQHHSKQEQQQTEGSRQSQRPPTQQAQQAKQQQQQQRPSSMQQPAVATASAVEETAKLLAAAKLEDDKTSKHAAGIHFKLPPHAYREFRAAGVVLYDFDSVSGRPANTRLLLVRHPGQLWCLPAGKLSKDSDGTNRPDLTAARELEEETHGLIPAAVSRAVLSACPQYYWHSGKMVLYFVRCTGGEQLPEMAAARLAAGRAHPAALKIAQLAWTSVDKIVSGSGFRGIEKKVQREAEAAAAAAAAAASAAEPSAASSPDPSSVPAPSNSLVASATAHDSGVRQLARPQRPQQPQQQQQKQADSGRLMLRSTLVVNRNAIVKWLEVLTAGEVAAPKLAVKPLQQQPPQEEQPQPAEEGPSVYWLQDPVVEVVPAAAAAAAAPGVMAGSSGTGAADSAVGAASALDAAAAVSAATAAALREAGAAPIGGSGGSSTGLVGDQPWALSLWSGQHDRATAEVQGTGQNGAEKKEGLLVV